MLAVDECGDIEGVLDEDESMESPVRSPLRRNSDSCVFVDRWEPWISGLGHRGVLCILQLSASGIPWWNMCVAFDSQWG
jgi:hypothetical protein